MDALLPIIHGRGYNRLYIDGGKTIQTFLKAGHVDELRITTLPILLGEGVPLFGYLPSYIELEHLQTKVYLNQLVQSHYRVVK